MDSVVLGAVVLAKSVNSVPDLSVCDVMDIVGTTQMGKNGHKTESMEKVGFWATAAGDGHQ